MKELLPAVKYSKKKIISNTVKIMNRYICTCTCHVPMLKEPFCIKLPNS